MKIDYTAGLGNSFMASIDIDADIKLSWPHENGYPDCKSVNIHLKVTPSKDGIYVDIRNSDNLSIASSIYLTNVGSKTFSIIEKDENNEDIYTEIEPTGDDGILYFLYFTGKNWRVIKNVTAKCADDIKRPYNAKEQ